jgi:hypothetical protein
VVPNRMHFTNMVAVQRSAQIRRQSGDIARQNMLRQQRMNQQLLLLSRSLPPPPEEGQTVERDVTSLGLKVSQTYTIKEALVAEGTYQFELVDANDKVLWSGVGDNREDAYLSMAIRLTEGEDPNDLPDYT